MFDTVRILTEPKEIGLHRMLQSQLLKEIYFRDEVGLLFTLYLYMTYTTLQKLLILLIGVQSFCNDVTFLRLVKCMFKTLKFSENRLYKLGQGNQI